MSYQPNHEYLHEGNVIEVNHKSYHIKGRMIQPMGRYSEVYRATSISSGKDYAIKIMIPEGSMLGPYFNHNVDERKHAFSIEIDLLRQLKGNPAVVKIHDHGIENGSGLPIIIEELYDISKRISTYKTVFSEQAAYCFSVQLFTLLASIHSKKIAYRDFQQPHFFFYWDEKAFDGVLKVVDWNLSSQGVIEDLSLEHEMESMRRNGLHNLFLSNSEIFKIVFREKHDTAKDVIVKLLKYGVKENFRCPSNAPIRYRIYHWWLKFQDWRR